MSKDAHGYSIVREGLNKNGTRAAFILRDRDGNVVHWGTKKECEVVRSSLWRYHQMKGEGPHVRTNPSHTIPRPSSKYPYHFGVRPLGNGFQGFARFGKGMNEITSAFMPTAEDASEWVNLRLRERGVNKIFWTTSDGFTQMTQAGWEDALREGLGMVSNPSHNHPPELPVGAEPLAYELASAVRYLLPEMDQLVKHLKKTSRRSDFDREKYAEFLAKTWVMPAAKRYYRNDADAKRYATLPVRRLAGEIYVDHVLDGEWA